jgi:hypothetical protein
MRRCLEPCRVTGGSKSRTPAWRLLHDEPSRIGAGFGIGSVEAHKRRASGCAGSASNGARTASATITGKACLISSRLRLESISPDCRTAAVSAGKGGQDRGRERPRRSDSAVRGCDGGRSTARMADGWEASRRPFSARTWTQNGNSDLEPLSIAGPSSPAAGYCCDARSGAETVTASAESALNPRGPGRGPT